MSNAVLVERIGKALVVRFNRPEIRSPLSGSVLTELEQIVRDVGSVEQVIFTGVSGVFASGADLKEIANLNADTARGFSVRGQQLMSAIAALRQTTIAAVSGYCFGGALDLALACNMRIASPNAEFSHPGANLGIITGWSGTQRLPRLVGEAAALEIFMTAKRIGSSEAKRIGLVDAIADDPLQSAIDFCMRRDDKIAEPI
jgi:enoyl-CoA hydratase/carnithine racemase